MVSRSAFIVIVVKRAARFLINLVIRWAPAIKTNQRVLHVFSLRIGALFFRVGPLMLSSSPGLADRVKPALCLCGSPRPAPAPGIARTALPNAFAPITSASCSSRFVVIDRDAVLHLHRRLHAALRLLDDVPGFVGQMLFLAGGNVDVGPLCVRQSVELCGLG